MNFIVIIPARFSSRRLPGKPLLNIHGQPMIVHVIEKAKASGASRVIVATDHHGIADISKKTGCEVYITHDKHTSGTSRLYETINYYSFSDDTIIVNLQSDEPMILPKMIRATAINLTLEDIKVSSLAIKTTNTKEIFNPNVVKVVLNVKNCALYFSRAPIPWNCNFFKKSKKLYNFLYHVGIYAYSAGFIRRYISWIKTKLEIIESLEQLRILWYGEKIYVEVIKEMAYQNINTKEDLDIIRNIMLYKF